MEGVAGAAGVVSDRPADLLLLLGRLAAGFLGPLVLLLECGEALLVERSDALLKGSNGIVLLLLLLHLHHVALLLLLGRAGARGSLGAGHAEFVLLL